MLVLLAVVAANGAAVISQSTDFGVRMVGASSVQPMAAGESPPPARVGRSTIANRAATIGALWGRVTSTYRSVAHNRAVGGVRNSWHLSGRAIDIARRRGVSHAEIASAFRAAGYSLIESLDEGDHSHFAFGDARSNARGMTIASTARQAPQYKQMASEMTDWGIVTVSSRLGRGALGR